MMAEALPFVQIDFSSGAGIAPSSVGRAQGTAAGPGLFESVMMSLAHDEGTLEAGRYPTLEQLYPILQAAPVFSQPVLDMLASLKDEIETEMPQTLDTIEALASDLLGEDGLERVEELLSRESLSREDIVHVAKDILSRPDTPALRRKLAAALLRALDGEDAQLPTRPPLFTDAPSVLPVEMETDVTGAQDIVDGPDAAPDDALIPQGTTPRPLDREIFPADDADDADDDAQTVARTDDASTPHGPMMASLMPASQPSETTSLNADVPARDVETNDARPAAQRQQPQKDDGAQAQHVSPRQPAADDLTATRAPQPRSVEPSGAPEDDARPIALDARHDDGLDRQGEDDGQGDRQTRGDMRRRSVADAPRAQRDDRATNASTTTENGRVDFQSFFEGVLRERRSIAQTDVAPLALRSNVPDMPQAETLRDGLVNVVRFVRADGAQRANVIVDPPALGRISVELTTTTSGVEASIKVASEQVRQLVQDQLVELRSALAQQGVQLAHFAVDVQQDDGRRQQGHEQGGRRRNARRVGVVDEAGESASAEFRVDLEQGLLHWVA